MIDIRKLLVPAVVVGLGVALATGGVPGSPGGGSATQAGLLGGAESRGTAGAPVTTAPGQPGLGASARPDPRIPGAYVVVLRREADAAAVRGLLGRAPDRVYTTALRGFAARLDAAALQRVRRHPGVAVVEPDQRVRALVSQPTPPQQYGLDRLDQRALPLSGQYSYSRSGQGVTAYIIDTGIAGHRDFGARASNVFDAFGGRGTDCNGHGTHVAGTVGGATYGVAKGIALRGVRVLDCAGSGSTSGVLAGVDRVMQIQRLPAVATMSLGGIISPTLDAAVTRLVDSGVPVAVAAGNESVDACLASPARARGVVTVAASDRSDRHATFSNHGTCVELYAPGVDITSTSLRGGTAVLSGTSMATPHVAGVLGLLLQGGRTTGARATAQLLSDATPAVITLAPPLTPNRLLHKGQL